MNELNRRNALRLGVLSAFGVTYSGCHAYSQSSIELGKQSEDELPESIASIKDEFEVLKTKWMVERDDYSHYSQIEWYWSGPVGKEIIAMGPRILPLVVKELRGGDFFFNYPMRVFTGFLLGGNDLDSEQDRSRLWIKWYDDLSQ